jgi:antirestriction protein ArdC
MRQNSFPSIYDEVTARIVAELEQGCVPWVQPWAKGAPLGLPKSAATTKPYSGINILILWHAGSRRGFVTQDWLTFKQALAVGGVVRKGERGTSICYAERFVPKAEQARAEESGDPANTIPFLKRFTVFNVTQCEGLPPRIVPPRVAMPDHEKNPQAEALIAATGARIVEGGGEAFYHQREDLIRLPYRETFVSQSDYYGTIFHELGHHSAHPSRLNRDLRGRFGSESYAREELIAELTSAFLCAAFDIVPRVRHADYLGHWLQILKSDSRAIFHAASQASKAFEFIRASGAPAIPPDGPAEATAFGPQE